MSVVQLSAHHAAQVLCLMVPCGLEPRTLRLLAVRSNQLSYETSWCFLRDGLIKKETMAWMQKGQRPRSRMSSVSVARVRGDMELHGPTRA